MLCKVLSAAMLAAVFSVSWDVAVAQSVRQINGPAEQPPAGYKGQTYVDSRGCVFLRAGYGGQINWVPRVNRDRKVLCGYGPTATAKADVTAAPAIATPPAPVEIPLIVEKTPAAAPTVLAAPKAAVGKPMETIATLKAAPTVRVPSAPVAVAAPRVAPAAIALNTTAIGPGKIGCYTSAPVPKVFRTADGGTVVLCTRGDGSMEGLRAPIYGRVAMGDGQRVGAGIYPPNINGRAARAARVANENATSVVAAAPDAVARPPKGYKAAWQDDRLNPHRAKGTAQGQAQQDQVWTREVPARLVSDVAQGKVTKRRVMISSKSDPAAGKIRVSSKGVAASAPQAAGALYVQIGTFGVPANADGAKARLRAAGLPVGTSKITKSGKALQIVMAGPFGNAGAAQAALNAAHGAGFGDAFIR